MQMTLRKETRPDAWRQRRETVSPETVKDYSTVGGTHVTVYELNRMVSAWDERDRVSRNKSGHVACPYIKAEGGTWLASMATLIGASVKTIKINGTPRPAVQYRGVWFVNFDRTEKK